jgi:hypothetical protein
MHNKKLVFKAKIVMALILFVIVGSFVWPLLSSKATTQTADKLLFFEDMESALNAFSMICLRSEVSFSSIKNDLADSGASVTEFQRDNQNHTIYYLPQIGGSVVFTMGENSDACGMTAQSEYSGAEAAAIDWFLKQGKASYFPMFGDQSHLRASGVTNDAHVWKLETPSQNMVDLVQIKEVSKGHSSLSRIVIDFDK